MNKRLRGAFFKESECYIFVPSAVLGVKVIVVCSSSTRCVDIFRDLMDARLTNAGCIPVLSFNCLKCHVDYSRNKGSS